MAKQPVERHDPLFELIKNMSKAEKRNFKLYATRLEGNRESKFMAVFNHLEKAVDYDERKILAECPVSKKQLSNVKSHLYQQILSSIRMIETRHSDVLKLREQLDFAIILYDKGLYKQCGKIVESVKEHAAQIENHAISLSAVSLENKLWLMNSSNKANYGRNTAHNRVMRICKSIQGNTELSHTYTQVYSLYLQLGYARTQKDLDLIKQYFKPRLEYYSERQCEMSFTEKFYFYQASAWYYYIQHNFVQCYRYSRKWVDLFDRNPRMKRVMYDDYLKGCSQILDGLYLMLKYRHFSETLCRFQEEIREIGKIGRNAYILAHRILFLCMINKSFIEGSFKEGIRLVVQIEEFVQNYSDDLDIHYKMLVNYKIACLYFGEGRYEKCMHYLARITTTKDPRIRRDVQCYARMLNLIASYEAGIDLNMDYQIRSVYSFLVKMNDMNAVQKEMLSFLKRLNYIYADDLKDELKRLYERLKPYEDHPYERRTFYYLDILSWLESKITNRTVGEIIRGKFRALSA